MHLERKDSITHTHQGDNSGKTSKLYSGDMVGTPPGYIQKVI